MTEFREKGLQFFLHRIAAVIGSHRDGLMLPGSRARHATNDLDAALVNYVGRERR